MSISSMDRHLNYFCIFLSFLMLLFSSILSFILWNLLSFLLLIFSFSFQNLSIFCMNRYIRYLFIIMSFIIDWRLIWLHRSYLNNRLLFSFFNNWFNCSWLLNLRLLNFLLKLLRLLIWCGFWKWLLGWLRLLLSWFFDWIRLRDLLVLLFSIFFSYLFNYISIFVLILSFPFGHKTIYDNLYNFKYNKTN